MNLFLFDIDGTLISSQGSGGKAFEKALFDIFNTKISFEPIELAGRTDSYLFHLAIKKYQKIKQIESISVEEHKNLYNQIKNQYLNYLKNKVVEFPSIVLPSVEQIIIKLHQDKNSVLALLTGNLADGAKLKLGSLFSYFEFGAYGDNEQNRNNLFHIAIQKYKKLYDVNKSSKNKIEKVYVIGDTPFDIECGIQGGAITIAVATGPYSIKQLEKADYTFDNLSNAIHLF